MRTLLIILVIAAIIYSLILAWTGFNAFIKYEHNRLQYGTSNVKILNVGIVDLQSWINQLNIKDPRFIAGRFSFDIYNRDGLTLLGKNVMVDDLIEVYIWNMPRFDIFDAKENLHNGRKLFYRLKHGLVGDLIEMGTDMHGNRIARLSLKGNIISIWHQDGTIPFEYVLVSKNK